MRILMTGASGFVGDATARALGTKGIELHAIGRNKPNCEAIVSWHRTDLFNDRDVRKVMGLVRPRAILHLAWYVEHNKFWSAPENLRWVDATTTLFRIGAEYGVERFVGTGTCYEYDWPTHGCCNEIATTIRPTTLYAEAKDATRRALHLLATKTSVELSWARLFFLFGPGEKEGRLVSTIARALARGESASCTSGVVFRDYIDVTTAGEALSALTLSNVTGPVNIASGTPIRVADLALRLGQLAGHPELVKIGALPDRPNEPLLICADVDRLRNEVGYVPTRTLDDALTETLCYWRMRETQR